MTRDYIDRMEQASRHLQSRIARRSTVISLLEEKAAELKARADLFNCKYSYESFKYLRSLIRDESKAQQLDKYTRKVLIVGNKLGLIV